MCENGGNHRVSLSSEPPMAVKPPPASCRRLEAGSGPKHARRGRFDGLKQSI